MMKDAIAEHQIELATGLIFIKQKELSAFRLVLSPSDFQRFRRLIGTDEIFGSQYVNK